MNKFEKMGTKELLELAGVDTSTGKAKMLVENDDVTQKYNELRSDKQYMHDLVSDMLDSEGKDDTPENRNDALKRASGKYLKDIAREMVNK